MGCNLDFEKALWKQSGITLVAGIDEAGRGPLAGPVMAAAVILPRSFKHTLLTDSKKLSAARREEIYEEITGNSKIIWSSAKGPVDEIDRVNILKSTHLAMQRATEGLAKTPDHVIIDGLPVPNFPYSQDAIVKGDSKSLSIAAASIIAKVERDRLMLEYASQYPEYGFESHKGYGTKKHLAAIQKYGPCPIHRKSFRPVSQRTFDFGE